MRAKHSVGVLLLLVGALFIHACESSVTNNGLEESFSVFTDLEPVKEASNVTATIQRRENLEVNEGRKVGDDAWFQIKLNNIAENSIINNGTVGAWCLEWKKPLSANNDVHKGSKIYSTAGSEKWAPMNYFFAIKRQLQADDPSLTPREFQAVVWSLAGQIGIAPEFNVMKLSNDELPNRLMLNGQPNFSKEKVVSIVNRVNSEYQSAQKSKIAGFGGVTVMETHGDEQDVVIPDPPPTIEEDTNIFIYFDASGSMNSTLSPLQTMRSTLLKDALLPFYDGDEQAYDDRVQIVSPFNERTMDWFNLGSVTPPADGNVIVLIFQDEAHTVYHQIPFSDAQTRTSTYNQDISDLRSALDGYIADPNKGSTYFRGVLFQVDNPSFFGGSTIGEAFQGFVKSVEDGTGNYSGTNGLSDRSEFNYVYDVQDGDTPTVYRNLIIDALQDLGFAIPDPT